MKEKKVFFILSVIVLFCCVSIIFGRTSTTLEIANSPPYLEEDIPIVSFEKGDYVNVFDLDDYFNDYERDPLNYSYQNPYPEILDISISKKGIVNFSALKEINKTGHVFFRASDGFYLEKSNPVKFYIGEDLLSPYFSKQSKSKDQVFQNDFIEFSVNVYDDREIKEVELIFKQQNPERFEKFSKEIGNKSSKVSFRKQIAAPSNTRMEWRFCAYDTYNNTNCTQYESFNVKEPLKNESEKEINYSTEKANFFVEPEYLIFRLKQGQSVTKTLEITNKMEGPLDFNVHLSGLKNIVFLSEERFSINGKKSRSLSLDASADENLVPGEYNGKIIIDSIKQIEIPCIVNVNSVNADYTIQSRTEEKKVGPGDTITSKISIQNKGEEKRTININYAIKDFEGNEYISENETKEISESLEFEKSLTVPEDLDEGKYIFYVKITDNEKYIISSDGFFVGQKYDIEKILFYLSIGLIVLILSFILFFFIRKYKLKKEKEKALTLYLQFQDLKKYIEKGKYNKAANLYLSIKKRYGQKVPENIVKNKEELVKRIKSLYKTLSLKKESSDEDSEDKNKDKKKSKGKKSSEKNKDKEKDKESSDKDSDKKEKEDKEESDEEEDKEDSEEDSEDEDKEESDEEEDKDKDSEEDSEEDSEDEDKEESDEEEDKDKDSNKRERESEKNEGKKSSEKNKDKEKDNESSDKDSDKKEEAKNSDKKNKKSKDKGKDSEKSKKSSKEKDNKKKKSKGKK